MQSLREHLSLHHASSVAPPKKRQSLRTRKKTTLPLSKKTSKKQRQAAFENKLKASMRKTRRHELREQFAAQKEEDKSSESVDVVLSNDYVRPSLQSKKKALLEVLMSKRR